MYLGNIDSVKKKNEKTKTDRVGQLMQTTVIWFAASSAVFF